MRVLIQMEEESSMENELILRLFGSLKKYVSAKLLCGLKYVEKVKGVSLLFKLSVFD